jgi:inhibitor of cysteine peptidase
MRKGKDRWSAAGPSCWFAVLILLAAFSVFAHAGEEITVGEKDAGSAVRIAEGDILRVILRGNPTTGYTWEVSSVDRSVLKPAGVSFRPDRKLIGSGGTVTLTFEALAAGRTDLQIVYRRVFERDIPPSRIFERTVIVSPKP